MGQYQKLSATKLADMATKAANDFLNPPHISLNESVRKTALDHDLTPEEIGRVVEAANKEVYLSAFPRTEKPFEFKLACAEEVCDALNKPLPKYAAEDMDWRFKVVDGPEKTASEKAAEKLARWEPYVGTESQILQRELAQAELRKDNAEVKLAAAKRDMQETITHFVKTAKQMALDGQNLYKIGVALGKEYPEHKEIIGAMLDKAMVCAEKTASPVNETWINEAMTASGRPVQVINGKHALVYDIDLLIDQSRTMEGCQQGLYRVHDEVDFIRRNMKNLSGLEKAEEGQHPESPHADPELTSQELIKQYLTGGE